MKDKLLSGGGIITALLASLCCITPVLGGLGAELPQPFHSSNRYVLI